MGVFPGFDGFKPYVFHMDQFNTAGGTTSGSIRPIDLGQANFSRLPEQLSLASWAPYFKYAPDNEFASPRWTTGGGSYYISWLGDRIWIDKEPVGSFMSTYYPGASGVYYNSFNLEGAIIGPPWYAYAIGRSYSSSTPWQYGDYLDLFVELDKVKDAFGHLTCTPSTTSYMPYFTAYKFFTEEPLSTEEAYSSYFFPLLGEGDFGCSVDAAIFGFWSDGKHLRHTIGATSSFALGGWPLNGLGAESSRPYLYYPDGLIDPLSKYWCSRAGNYWPISRSEIGDGARLVPLITHTADSDLLPFSFDFGTGPTGGYVGVSHCNVQVLLPGALSGSPPVVYLIAIYDVFSSPFDDISSTCYTSKRRVHFKSDGSGFVGKFMIALVNDFDAGDLESGNSRIFATKQLNEKNIVINLEDILSGTFFNDWNFISEQNIYFRNRVPAWRRDFTDTYGNPADWLPAFWDTHIDDAYTPPYYDKGRGSVTEMLPTTGGDSRNIKIGLYNDYSLRAITLPPTSNEWCTHQTLFQIPVGEFVSGPLYPTQIAPDGGYNQTLMFFPSPYGGEPVNWREEDPANGSGFEFIKVPGVDGHPIATISAYCQAIGTGQGGWRVGSIG